MATRTPSPLNRYGGASWQLRRRMGNIVKDKAHEAKPANELNRSGEHDSRSQGMLRAAFQPKAGSWNRNTGLILEVSRKGRGQAAPAKFSQQETI
jgi:hypothetical protein